MGENVDEEEEDDKEEEVGEEEEEEMGSDLDGLAPTPNRCRLANDSALTASLYSRCCIFF